MNKSPPDLSDIKGLDWLVVARCEIQKLMLEYYNNSKSLSDKESHLTVGALFSLWRAVFLVESENVERNMSSITIDARSYLKKLIVINAINFGDDMEMRTWSSGYYLNNARYRVRRLLDNDAGSDPMPSITNAILKNVWNETFCDLWAIIHEEVVTSDTSPNNYSSVRNKVYKLGT